MWFAKCRECISEAFVSLIIASSSNRKSKNCRAFATSASLKNIFISKDTNELETLNELMGDHSFRFECRSLIDFKPRSFDLPNDFDVIFFSSIRSAKFLSESKKIDLDRESLGI